MFSVRTPRQIAGLTPPPPAASPSIYLVSSDSKVRPSGLVSRSQAAQLCQPRGRGVGRGPSRKAYLGAPRPEWAVAALVDGVPWGEEHLHTLYTHSHNTMSGVEFRGAFTSQTRNGTSLCDGCDGAITKIRRVVNIPNKASRRDRESGLRRGTARSQPINVSVVIL